MTAPLYEAAKDALVEKIRDGKFSVGTVLPVVDDLALQLGFSKATVRKALLELADEGLVDRVRCKGTIVTARPKHANVVLLQTGDPDTNELLVEPLYRNLHAAGFGVDVVPFALQFDAALENCERLRHQGRSADFLLSLEYCSNPRFLDLASRFRHYLFFSYGEQAAPPAHCISLDWSLAARQVMQSFLDLGHRRIAVANPDDGSFIAAAATQCRHLVEVAGAEFVTCGFLQERPDHIQALLKKGVTAYWAVSDYEAITVMKHLALAGLGVPDQFSIVGRNDTRWCRLSEVPLSTVAWNTELVSQEVVRTVQECLNGSARRRHLVQPTLVQRHSVGRAPPRTYSA